MKATQAFAAMKETKDKINTSATLGELEDKCKNCSPLSPIICVTSCNAWKLKNELKKMRDKVKDPQFQLKLLNALKNVRRLEILEMVSKGRRSAERLQQEMRKLGHQHSRETITEEYVEPLISVGLINEDRSQYYATAFGNRIYAIAKDLKEIGNRLPPHSECYEELALRALLDFPKTFEDLQVVVPSKGLARVLHRLQEEKLIQTSTEKDRVFFFKTQRSPINDNFSSTERRVYANIPVEGISARKLAQKTAISLRRTYRYLRRLKGKKLVFTRNRPRRYALSSEGTQLAMVIDGIFESVAETHGATTQTEQYRESLETQIAKTPLLEPTRRRTQPPAL
jgi:predicted transcriptional regulator